MSQTVNSNTPLTYDEFKAWYPEFADVPQGAVENQLDLSNMTLAYSAWGKWWRQAVGLFTAHYLALRFDISNGLAANGVKSPLGTIGVVTNKSANTSSLSEGSTVSGLVTSSDPIEADFGRTEYGLRYLSLLEMVVPTGNIIKSPDASEAIGRSGRWW